MSYRDTCVSREQSHVLGAQNSSSLRPTEGISVVARYMPNTRRRETHRLLVPILRSGMPSFRTAPAPRHPPLFAAAVDRAE